VLALTVRQLLSRPGTRVVVLAASKDTNAKVTVLLVPAGSDTPRLAVKVPTTDVAQCAVCREARLLAELARRDLGPVAATLPRVVGLAEHAGRLALVTTALRGVTLSSRYHAFRHLARPRAVAADFAAAGGWLAAFQAATAGPSAPVDLVRPSAAVIARRFPADPRLPDLLLGLERLADVLGAARTPRTVVHGDVWCGNLLVRAATVTGVVDWEAGAATGEPLRDIARFALSYALYLDRHTAAGRSVAGHPGLVAGRWGDGVRYALHGAGWFPAAVRGFLADGLTRLGADAALWREVAVAGVAEIAANADHDGFAAHHLELLHDLLHGLRHGSVRGAQPAAPPCPRRARGGR
jgi:aminoglycoside phosphotransferase (APT) family kinase protein